MSYRLDLAVLTEENGWCRFGLTLHNLTDADLNDWSLNFVIDRYIHPDTITNSHCHQTESNVFLTPDRNKLAANDHFYCEFSIETPALHFYQDGIREACIVQNGSYPVKRSPVMVCPMRLLSPYQENPPLPDIPAAEYAVIPKPDKCRFMPGRLILTRQSQINLQTSDAAPAARWFEQEILRLHHFKFNPIGAAEVVFQLNPTLNRETYKLSVEHEGICIEASEHAGFVYACSTLLQLCQSDGDNLIVPLVIISDAPRFRYRGMMLDCARHFHTTEQVKRLINQLALYKFNVFHWHLTDDEGWRIEIKAFPELTRAGAWRGPEEALEAQYSHLSGRHGGYYSQEEIRSVIDYAAERGITVIPEIDIPGHCRAAIHSLPHLLRDPDDDSVYRSVQHYDDNILSPALPGTYRFLDAVLSEVAALFPAPYVHIGGDEVPEGAWTDSARCLALMSEQGYTDTKELQGHLLRYAEQTLRSLGKRMLGWEEVQHGNKVSKDTVIFSWLSEEAALRCAGEGYDVVLQPGQTTYLDMVQGFAPNEPGMNWAGINTLEKTYRYDPLAQVADHDPIRQRILGIQCALWCERIADTGRMEYMLYPRLTALAEAAWTEKSLRNWEDYLARLKGHLPLLDQQNIQYRAPWQSRRAVQKKTVIHSDSGTEPERCPGFQAGVVQNARTP